VFKHEQPTSIFRHVEIRRLELLIPLLTAARIDEFVALPIVAVLK
jgi:hypothetical protein